MGDIGGIRPSGPGYFDRMEPTGPNPVPDELTKLFDKMRDVYRKGDVDQMKQVSSQLVQYLIRPGVQEVLEKINPSKKEAINQVIDQFLQADKRLQGLEKAPVGFPLSAKAADPTFGPFIMAVKEHMYTQVGHRDSLQQVMWTLDPAHYPPPRNTYSGE